MFRVESWRDGVLVTAKTVPNLNAARVYMAHQEQAGFRTLLIRPWTESERAA